MVGNLINGKTAQGNTRTSNIIKSGFKGILNRAGLREKSDLTTEQKHIVKEASVPLESLKTPAKAKFVSFVANRLLDKDTASSINKELNINKTVYDQQSGEANNPRLQFREKLGEFIGKAISGELATDDTKKTQEILLNKNKSMLNKFVNDANKLFADPSLAKSDSHQLTMDTLEMAGLVKREVKDSKPTYSLVKNPTGKVKSAEALYKEQASSDMPTSNRLQYGNKEEAEAEAEAEKKTNAATKIQSVARGFNIRNGLESIAQEKAKKVAENLAKFSSEFPKNDKPTEIKDAEGFVSSKAEEVKAKAAEALAKAKEVENLMWLGILEGQFPETQKQFTAEELDKATPAQAPAESGNVKRLIKQFDNPRTNQNNESKLNSKIQEDFETLGLTGKTKVKELAKILEEKLNMTKQQNVRKVPTASTVKTPNVSEVSVEAKMVKAEATTTPTNILLPKEVIAQIAAFTDTFSRRVILEADDKIEAMIPKEDKAKINEIDKKFDTSEIVIKDTDDILKNIKKHYDSDKNLSLFSDASINDNNIKTDRRLLRTIMFDRFKNDVLPEHKQEFLKDNKDLLKKIVTDANNTIKDIESPNTDAELYRLRSANLTMNSLVDAGLVEREVKDRKPTYSLVKNPTGDVKSAEALDKKQASSNMPKRNRLQYGNKEEAEKKTNAATKIQSVARGFNIRNGLESIAQEKAKKAKKVAENLAKFSSEFPKNDKPTEIKDAEGFVSSKAEEVKAKAAEALAKAKEVENLMWLRILEGQFPVTQK